MVSDEKDGLEATVWRWLRELYLRLLCTAVRPESMTIAEQNLLLDPHHRAMEADLRVVMMFVERGQSEAIGAWRSRIHRTEGTDHEMLDEALDYAMHGQDVNELDE